MIRVVAQLRPQRPASAEGAKHQEDLRSTKCSASAEGAKHQEDLRSTKCPASAEGAKHQEDLRSTKCSASAEGAEHQEDLRSTKCSASAEGAEHQEDLRSTKCFEAVVDDQVRDYFSTAQLAAIEASAENQVIWEIPAPATYLTELTTARRTH